METLAFIENLIHDYNRQLRSVAKQLKQCPEGRLVRSSNNGKTSVMQVTGKGPGAVRRRISKDPKLQVKLARRAVLEKEQSVLLRKLEVLNKSAETLRTISAVDRYRFVMDNYGWMPPENLDQIFRHEAADSWVQASYERYDGYPEQKKMITSRGLALRSKSELLIAKMLYRYGIPFRYEQVIHINDNLFLVPDFTILCPDGKVFIWEHEGLINKQSYVERQRRKAEYYALLGHYPWDDLIITYDTADGEIDLRAVEFEIKNRILNGHGW